jgi:hypothetical protein
MRVVSSGAPFKPEFVEVGQMFQVVKGDIHIESMVISCAYYFPLRVKSRLKTEIISCAVICIVIYQ